MLNNLKTKFILGIAFGVVVLAGLGLYADFHKLAQGVLGFPLKYVPFLLGLTLFNYLLRFFKWQFYLHRIGVRDLPWQTSMMLFFSGLSMAVTPGKIGEWLKSYLLREVHGTPFARSAPVIVAERLTDGIAMVLLASGGLVIFRTGWQVALLVTVLCVFIITAIQVRRAALFFLGIAEMLPLLSNFTHHFHDMYESATAIFNFKSLAVGIVIGLVSWSGECLAFYLVLNGLGQEASLLLLLQATFILAVVSLGGSIFLMPGGLGIAEGGIIGLCQALLGMPRDLAATAAIIIRLSTLWFGVCVGLLFLALANRRLKPRSPLLGLGK